MTAKQYLSLHEQEERRIKLIEEKIDRLYQEFESIKAVDYSKDPVMSTSSPHAGYTNIVEQIDEEKIKLISAKSESIKLKFEIEIKIEKMPDGKYKEVLNRRYILLQTFPQIASEMKYGYRHITRIHGEALKSFSELYNFPK